MEHPSSYHNPRIDRQQYLAAKEIANTVVFQIPEEPNQTEVGRSSPEEDCQREIPIFCDIDEVLADFRMSIQEWYSSPAGNKMKVGVVPAFYTKMPITTEGKRLWEILAEVSNKVSVLTRQHGNGARGC